MVLALWTIASTAATVLKIVADGSRATLAPLYCALRGILVSDRATALTFWAMERRQICQNARPDPGIAVARSPRGPVPR